MIFSDSLGIHKALLKQNFAVEEVAINWEAMDFLPTQDKSFLG